MVLELTQEDWGEFRGRTAKLYTIADKDTGYLVQITDFGATLVRVKTPDKDGNISDINFGQDKVSDFVDEDMYLGAMVGRVANRIENGEFELEGKVYKLAKNNNGKHCLHGGIEGFTYKYWDLKESGCDGKEAYLIFHYVSPDGEEGFPGNLETTIKYYIRADPMQLGWEIRAQTDKTTIVNMTNHAYWNLESLDTLIDNHILRLDCNKFMLGDEDGLVIPGEKDVESTGLDFRKGKSLKEAFEEFGDIDNNFFINGYDPSDDRRLNFAGELYSPATGRVMKVETNQPCVHIYTGNYMEGHKSFGKDCKKHSAVCLECQKVPNAINLPEYRESVILKPGEEYYHHTLHTFGVKK